MISNQPIYILELRISTSLVELIFCHSRLQVQNMAGEEDYDYSATLPFVEAFTGWARDEPFITDMPETYGKLWQFKSCVNSWSFGVNRFKDYVFLRHRVNGTTLYVNWNLNEKISLVECHQRHYMLIVLQAVDNDGRDIPHNHSIVCHEEDTRGTFDLDTLLAFLQGTSLETLAEDFSRQFHPWVKTNAESMARKINKIFTTLDRYALQHVEKQPRPSQVRGKARRESDSEPRSASGTRGRSGGIRSGRGLVQAESRKRRNSEPGAAEPVEKKPRSASEARPSGAGSSGSALTNVQSGNPTDYAPIEKFEIFAAYQKDFWQRHAGCFLFTQQCFPVSIDQCILAADKYVIRKLEQKIVEGMKKQLITLGDAKQRQKICLTPVGPDGRLLKQRPKQWDDIKSGKFMIINGQHSITASQQLQLKGCGEERKNELKSWDAVIVWTLDPAQLTEISKFYNSANHLTHSQPTWGNQIVSCRNIWLSYKRPSSLPNEADSRGNMATMNADAFTVRSSPTNLSSSRR